MCEFLGVCGPPTQRQKGKRPRSGRARFCRLDKRAQKGGRGSGHLLCEFGGIPKSVARPYLIGRAEQGDDDTTRRRQRWLGSARSISNDYSFL